MRTSDSRTRNPCNGKEKKEEWKWMLFLEASFKEKEGERRWRTRSQNISRKGRKRGMRKEWKWEKITLLPPLFSIRPSIHFISFCFLLFDSPILSDSSLETFYSCVRYSSSGLNHSQNRQEVVPHRKNIILLPWLRFNACKWCNKKRIHNICNKRESKSRKPGREINKFLL